MLRKHLGTKTTTEFGFTLIELLVVILIIGVLASIAIPAFLNQRQRTNDAAVEADVRNAILVVDYNVSALGNNVNTSSPDVGAIYHRVLTASRSEVKLSPGVHLAIHTTNTGFYCITGYHDNGREYVSATQALTYKNIPEGGGWDTGCVTTPTPEQFLTGR